MKRILFATLTLFTLSAYSQTDTIPQKTDTVKIGNMIIIKNENKGSKTVIISSDTTQIKPRAKKSKISTNWCVVDLGFNNYTDHTNYTDAAATGFTAPGIGKDDLKLRNGKSINVNIWFFTQKWNPITPVVGLKYGLGIELNNYRFKQPVIFETSPTRLVKDTDRHFSKNKLAADYITVPLMLDFNFTPRARKNNSFGLSAGISAGYLYSSRQKTITSENGKQKNHDDFDLRPFKISYVAELKLGPVKLYGSLATRSMFEKGLDITPYNFGFRISE